MTINIETMTHQNVAQVHTIEKECFAIPWSYSTFKLELENPLAIYIVASIDGQTVGFAGMHHVLDEGHITNIAVLEEHRGQGIGDALVRHLCGIADAKNITGLVLEVRMGNASAQRLYSKHGFAFAGIRKNYYVDTKEDAIVMWKYFKPEVAQ